MSDREPNLARPWARHRVLIYLGVAIFTGLVFGLMTVGVGVGLIEPTFTSDVVANLLFGVPVILHGGRVLCHLVARPGHHQVKGNTMTWSRTSHRAYRRNRKRVLRNSTICAICGEPLNPNVQWPDPMSITADHIIPIADGGDNLGPLRAVQNRCNQRRWQLQQTNRHGRHGEMACQTSKGVGVCPGQAPFPAAGPCCLHSQG